MNADVQGRCPACGKASLFLGSGGYVTCSWIECPEPDAASSLLEPTPAARLRAAADRADEAARLTTVDECRIAHSARAAGLRDAECIIGAPVPVPADVRDQIAEAMHGQMPGCTHDQHGNDCAALADAVLRVPAIAEALTAGAAVGELRTALAMQTGVSADLRVESKARGDKLERIRDAAALHRQGLISLSEFYAVIGPAKPPNALDLQCPNCGPLGTERHPRLPVTRCSNCKEHLAALDPQERP